jgi:hypothetical protein
MAEAKHTGGDEKLKTCLEFQNLPPAFQMPVILRRVSYYFPDELLPLRRRVKDRLDNNWRSNHYLKPPVKSIDLNATDVAVRFYKLHPEHTLPTITNLLPNLSEIDLKEIKDEIDKRLRELNQKVPWDCCIC